MFVTLEVCTLLGLCLKSPTQNLSHQNLRSVDVFGSTCRCASLRRRRFASGYLLGLLVGLVCRSFLLALPDALPAFLFDLLFLGLFLHPLLAQLRLASLHARLVLFFAFPELPLVLLLFLSLAVLHLLLGDFLRLLCDRLGQLLRILVVVDLQSSGKVLVRLFPFLHFGVRLTAELERSARIRVDLQGRGAIVCRSAWAAKLQ
mmetsp:Transcript_82552/g.230174  ORF Transcript_82552/g.230174 Transcript_82552/m.230174 type:complete len:203 (+) Transcript_82552:173-781(+)